MDDEYDIYGDLDGFEIQTQKESKFVKELSTEIEELKAKIIAKESEKEVIAKKNGILLENISSLLLTAKAEIKRKDTLIADIRRQRDDNAFRRNSRSVRKCDKWTQTASIHLLDQEAQTENVGTITDKTLSKERDRNRDRDRRHSRSRSREHRHKREHSRRREKPIRNDLRDRLKENRGKTDPIKNRRDSRTLPLTIRERERDRDQRTRRREKRSPKLSPVKFPSMLRKSKKEVSNADSVSEAKLADTFIPMNEKELDRFVKEMTRCGNRSPDMCTLDTVSNSDMWDATLVKQISKTTRRESKSEENTDIIQSDEIGTTAVGASSSPSKVEDVEQKMRALHGESTPASQPIPECIQTSMELLEGLNKSLGTIETVQPVELVVPPQQPQIFEKVPELPSEDDQRLNDSRELRIVESEDATVDVEDDCHSMETVIEKQLVDNEDLEEGELISSDESYPGDDDLKRTKPVPGKARSPKKEIPKRITKRRDSEAKILLDKLSDSDLRYHSQRSHHRKVSDRNNSKPESKVKSKYDRALDTFVKTSTPSRRRSLRSDVSEKEKPRSRLSEPIHRRGTQTDEKKQAKSKKQSMEDLFGSDDDNSVLRKSKVTAKRRHSKHEVESADRKKQKVCTIVQFKEKGVQQHTDAYTKDVVFDSKSNELILVQGSLVEPLEDVQTEQTIDVVSNQSSLEMDVQSIPAQMPGNKNSITMSSLNLVQSATSSETDTKSTSKKITENVKTEEQSSSRKALTDEICLLKQSNNNFNGERSVLKPETDKPEVAVEKPKNITESVSTGSQSNQEISTNKTCLLVKPNTQFNEERQSTIRDQANKKSDQPEVPSESSENMIEGYKTRSQSKHESLTDEQCQQLNIDKKSSTFEQAKPESDKPHVSTENSKDITEIQQDIQAGSLSTEQTSMNLNEDIKPTNFEQAKLQTDKSGASSEDTFLLTGSVKPHEEFSQVDCAVHQTESMIALKPDPPEIPEITSNPATGASCNPPDSQHNVTSKIIVFSNKYSEFRIEDNSELETTVYVTRKKKGKKKSRNASLNVSG